MLSVAHMQLQFLLYLITDLSYIGEDQREAGVLTTMTTQSCILKLFSWSLHQVKLYGLKTKPSPGASMVIQSQRNTTLCKIQQSFTRTEQVRVEKFRSSGCSRCVLRWTGICPTSFLLFTDSQFNFLKKKKKKVSLPKHVRWHSPSHYFSLMQS